MLSGGGALGSYEAGVVCGLAESESFDLVTGASIGSLNGALYAQGDLPLLERVWRSVVGRNLVQLQPPVAALADLLRDVYGLVHDGILKAPVHVVDAVREFGAVGPLDRLATLTGALDPTPLIGLLHEVLDFSKLERSFIVRATNLTRATADSFYAFRKPLEANGDAFVKAEPTAHAFSAENYLDAVRGSAALPGALSPVTVGTPEGPFSYVDGAVAGTTPVGQAIDAGADHVTVVFVDPESTPQPMPANNLVQIALTSLAVNQQRLLTADLEATKGVNDSIAKGWLKGKRHVELRAIRPSADLGMSFLDFSSQEKMDAAFERGLADGRAAK